MHDRTLYPRWSVIRVNRSTLNGMLAGFRFWPSLEIAASVTVASIAGSVSMHLEICGGVFFLPPFTGGIGISGWMSTSSANRWIAARRAARNLLVCESSPRQVLDAVCSRAAVPHSECGGRSTFRLLFRFLKKQRLVDWALLILWHQFMGPPALAHMSANFLATSEAKFRKRDVKPPGPWRVGVARGANSGLAGIMRVVQAPAWIWLKQRDITDLLMIK